MSAVLQRRRYSKTNRSQRLVAAFEVKELDAGKRTFQGSLSSSHLDLGNGYERDIVWPKAFKRWIASFKSGGYVPLIDSHDRWSILNVFGHLVDVEERLTGKTLEYALQNGRTLQVPEMFLDTSWQVIDGQDGDRILDRVRPGSVRKMSMGYEPVKFDNDTLDTGERLRNLREVRVEEGSLVIFPMNPMADVDPETVKALLLKDNPTEEERATLLDLYEKLGTILHPAGAPSDPPPPAPEGPQAADPETIKRVQERIAGITAHRLATRISAVRHSAADVLTVNL